jgi:hypothetical protein
MPRLAALAPEDISSCRNPLAGDRIARNVPSRAPEVAAAATGMMNANEWSSWNRAEDRIGPGEAVFASGHHRLTRTCDPGSPNDPPGTVFQTSAA